jgi:hypothetical protein
MAHDAAPSPHKQAFFKTDDLSKSPCVGHLTKTAQNLPYAATWTVTRPQGERHKTGGHHV